MILKKLLTITTVVLLLSCLSTTAIAKNKTYYGFLVTTEDDTINGRIWMLSPTLNEVKVKITDYQKNILIYKSSKVKSYHFRVSQWNEVKKKHENEWIHYVKKYVERPPVPFGSKSALLHREVSGRISLYNHYYAVHSNVKQPYEHLFYIEKKHKHFLIINKANYKSVLRELMADEPIIVSKIGKRKYGFKYLVKTLKEYNYFVKWKTVLK